MRRHLPSLRKTRSSEVTESAVIRPLTVEGIATVAANLVVIATIVAV